jgi:hypothetical protein
MMASGGDHDEGLWGEAPAMMAVSRCPAGGGRTLPLAEPCRQPGGVLL